MSDNHLTLFCLVDGEAISNAFSDEIDPTKSVDHLENLIKTAKTPDFDSIAADKFTLWRVSFLITEENDETPILLDNVISKDKTKLGPATRLSKVFPSGLPEESVHIIVQHPLLLLSDDLHPEVAALRRQLSELEQFKAEVSSVSINVGIIVKPEKRVVFAWSMIVEKATLDDLRKEISELYTQYAHDDYLQIFVYGGQPKPERISDDDDLRRILRVARTTIRPRLTISLETPSKSFGAWTFKDVCEEYNLSMASEPELEALKPFTDVKSASLRSAFQRATRDLLIKEIEARVDALPLRGGNEATKSMVVASFLVAATRLFKDDLYLMSQRHLSGRRGNGPVDFSVHPRKTHDYTLGVTEAKRDDFRQGVAQNIVQLEAALTEKKRKREKHDLDGDEDPPSKQKAYGIVTNALQWAFLECTMLEDETVSFRMSWLSESLNFGGNWEDDATKIFAKIVWLWSRMVEEIPVRDSYSRKLSTPPNKRQARESTNLSTNSSTASII
ncbi:MAG: hypothetical protein J3R72DRAFT_435542 [Linnemannia gamsii]|nr:MAG: hypothetical protein J3R72DRAFT_435542 [Linnemannia gamsii]